MKLADLAHRDVISVMPTDSFDKAICLMEEHHIHHLPVVENSRVVGMLSDRDLLMAVGWKLEIERVVESSEHSVIGPKSVREIMSSPALYLAPENDLHTAARMMAEGKFHAFPMVQDGILVGMVTSTDILGCYSSLKTMLSSQTYLQDKIRNHMHVNVYTVGPREPLHAAARILKEKHIRHLPVATNKELLGLISDRDIRRACGQEVIEDEMAQAQGEFYIGPTTVMQIMSNQVETIMEEATILDAIKTMTERRIGCLPVVRGEELVGILTETDLLRLVARMDEGAEAQ